MKTLHLNLKQKWFEIILKGIKLEEYRDLSYYWFNRFVKNPRDRFGGLIGYYPEEMDLSKRNKCVDDIVNSKYFDSENLQKFDTITFSNGYATERPQFEIELKGIEIREGKPEWGAEPGKKYFVSKLGKILNDQNCAEILLKNTFL